MIPRLWPGSTVVCIATGPSLTQADVDACRGRARTIAVNDAYTIAPWADVLYACDPKWWKWHRGAPTFQGLKYTLEQKTVPPSKPWPDVQIVGRGKSTGLSLDRAAISTGHNSGYQAINLAVLFGAIKIVLLGYDMGRPARGRSHFFGEHPDKTQPNYTKCITAFGTLAAQLTHVGVDVVNCSRQTALKCFRREPLEAVLAERAA